MDFIKYKKNYFRHLSTNLTEDAVMQSDRWKYPNWHIAHVTWFFQKILEKHRQNIDASSINTDYLNSYYQRYSKILPKSDRGKFPRPKVSDTLKYRSLIEDLFLNFLDSIERNNSMTRTLAYDIELANQHEMQHQELIVYDLQHYFQRFEDPLDNYEPKLMKSTNLSKDADIEQGMVKVSGGLYELGFSGNDFCMTTKFQSIKHISIHLKLTNIL